MTLPDPTKNTGKQTMPEGKSEIPADILAAAERATHECYDPKTQVWYDVKDIIAKYLLAERETCAVIAESAGRQALSGYVVAGPASIVRNIVRHIRLGLQSPSTEENLQHD